MKKFKKYFKNSILCLVLVFVLSLCIFPAFAADFTYQDISFSQNDVVKYDSPSGMYPLYRRYHRIYNWYHGNSTNLPYNYSYGNSWFYNSLELGQQSESALLDWAVDMFDTLDPDSVYGFDDAESSIAPYFLVYYDPNTNDTVYNLIYTFRTGTHAGVYGYKLNQIVLDTGKCQYLAPNNPSGNNSCIYQVRIPSNWNGSFSGIQCTFTTNASDVMFAYQNIIACSSRFASGILSQLNISLSRSSTPNLYYYNTFGDIAYIFVDGPTETITDLNINTQTYIVANRDYLNDGYYYNNLYICTYVYVDPDVLVDFLNKLGPLSTNNSAISIAYYQCNSSPSKITSNTSVPVNLYRYSVQVYYTISPTYTNNVFTLSANPSKYKNQFNDITGYSDNDGTFIYIGNIPDNVPVDDIEVLWNQLSGGFNFLQSLIHRIYLILPPELYSMFVVSFAVIMLLALIRLAIT